MPSSGWGQGAPQRLVTRVLSSLLYGVEPADPLTFAAAAASLLSVAALACYLPTSQDFAPGFRSLVACDRLHVTNRRRVHVHNQVGQVA